MEAIVAKILVWVFPVLRSQLDYLIHYESKIDNLKAKVEELKEAGERVKRDVGTAKRNVKEIEADVRNRLTKYDDIIEEAGKILEDDQRSATMTYCNGCCPNLISRYQLSKRADEAALKAKTLKAEIGKIKSVGYREPTQLVGSVQLNRGYEDFESRMLTINGVLEALKDPNVNRIGVHGMGGVGKTMLVKEVLNQAKKENLFEDYVYVAVSKEPDMMVIQTKIAKQLGLELDKEDEFGRPDLLCKRLQQGKILLVMDDIWTPLKLEDVGYTFGADQKGCKLLFTSRFDKILYKDMNTQKQFPVGILKENEARNLFENIIGHSARIPEIQHTMLQIVEECSGLPVAITTVANALKNEEDISVWKDALNRFKISNPKKIDGMNKTVYERIKWSYEFLKNDEAKSLWLLCSLHGEDYDIEVEDLIRFCVGWNLFGDLGKIEQIRCRVSALVKQLKDCSLLLDGDYNGTVKMHDIIRDVAIDIAADERHMFTIRSSVELHERSKSKNSTVISLPYINDDLDLPNQFECSKLELLLLFGQKVDFCIPDSFFEGLKDLKVLKLSESWSGVLPSSLSSLENLQTLCLDGKVQNAFIIGELKKLKALSLSLSNTEQLPKEIGQLTHLHLLDLRECSELKFIPPNVLSNLKRLEELYLPDDVEWEVEAQSTERINAIVSELDHLSHLTKLHICIKDAKILPKAMVFERLESYRIAIGSAWLWRETSETSRILKLNISFQSDCGYKVLLRNSETLILGEMKGVKNNLYELNSEGFQSLKHLTVQDNDEIQYIIDSMVVLDSVFPGLESITLSNVNNLERICYTRLPTKTFCNLREVTVSNCCKLEFVFSSSMVGCFSHLQGICIEHCKIMSSIVAIEREEEIEVNSDDSIMFANLQYLSLRNLLKLKGFLSDADSLVLFNWKVVFPNLEILEIEGMDSMKMIWPDQFLSDCFGKLETMTVSNCTNLTNIVPPNMLRALPNLKHLKIDHCGSIEEVFEIQGTNNVEESRDIVAAELVSLTLINLRKLKHVWSMDPQGIITFEKLRTIEIYRCSSLKSVFPTSVAKALMQLEKLLIHDCATIEEIVAKEEGIETATLFIFPQLSTLILYKLPELNSFYPRKHTSKWPSLKELDIQNCDKLKIFGSNKESIEETNGLGHDVSLTQQPLFFMEKVVFPNLEELKIEGMDSMKMIWPNQLILDCFGKLKTMTVSGCKNLTNIVPPNTLRTLRNLKELKIYDCKSLEEVFEIQGTNNVEESHDIVAAELVSLKLRGLRKLKHIWSKDTQGIIAFVKLHTIEIDSCWSLKSVFPTSVAKALMQLKTLKIKGCLLLEEIVAKEEGIETATLFVFPQLTTLTLHDLPSLNSFYSGKHTSEWPLLKELNIQNCDKLKIFGSNKESIKETNGPGHDVSLTQQPLFFIEKVVFPNLEELKIEGMDSMKMIWPNQLISDCFGKQTTMIVPGCTNLTNIVPPNMLRTLRNLKELKIYGCNSLEEVFEIQGTNNVEESRDIVAAELVSLELRNLQKLKHMWSMDPQGIITFAKLRTIEIDSCSSLKSVFPTSIAKALMQLEELKIMNCAMMEEIVAKEEGIETATLFVFPQLTTLSLYNLPELNSFYPGKHTSKWPLLKELNIKNCDKLKIFGSSKESVEEKNGLGHDVSLTQQALFFIEKVVFPNMEELEIKDMDCTKMMFAKLRTIIIDGFSSLKSVFPTFVAMALIKLEQLSIGDCARVEEIVAKEEGIETTTSFVFPQLTTLILYNLPELKSFYLGKHTSEWPSLKSLQIQECDKLKIFGSNKSSVQETIGLSHHASLIQQPLFFIEKDKFPNLEELVLDEGDAMNETCGGPSAEFCCNLKVLSLYRNSDKLSMFPNVEAPIERAGVSDFRRLKNIVPFSSTSFHHLKELIVYGCDVLLSLLTPSTARTLVQLQHIRIEKCKRMTEIVANEGSEVEAGDEIAFNNLTSLYLIDLLSLTAFHLGNRTIKFPSLGDVTVDDCPKLKIFCGGVLSMPKLTLVCMGVKRISKEKGDGNLDLNATIKDYWEAKLETCKPKFSEKIDASEVRESEHDVNDNLERDTTSEVGDT